MGVGGGTYAFSEWGGGLGRAADADVCVDVDVSACKQTASK